MDPKKTAEDLKSYRVAIAEDVGAALAEIRNLGFRHGTLIVKSADRGYYLDALVDAGCTIVSVFPSKVETTQGLLGQSFSSNVADAVVVRLPVEMVKR